MSISYRFQEVKQSSTVKVKCPQCDKSRDLTVSRSYYRNGFHNESETRDKNRVAINKEVEQLQKDGKLCQSCEDANNGVPTLKKLDKDTFEVIDRETGEVMGKIARYTQGGWPKWECLGIRRKNARGHAGRVLVATRSEAVERLQFPDKHHLERTP